MAQVKVDFSPKAVSPVTKEALPKVKTNDLIAVHRDHNFYFQDTLARSLMRYTTSLGFSPADPASLNDLGYIYYYFGEYPDAEAQFKKALEINPAFVDAEINLGLTAYKSSRLQEALQYLNKAYQMDSSRGDAAYNLGLLTFEQGDFSRAAGFFEEASKTLANDPKVWNNLGCSYFKEKNYSQAYQSFKTSVDKGAAFYHAYYNLALASVVSGNYTEAVVNTQKAVQLSPENADAHNLFSPNLRPMRRMPINMNFGGRCRLRPTALHHAPARNDCCGSLAS